MNKGGKEEGVRSAKLSQAIKHEKGGSTFSDKPKYPLIEIWPKPQAPP